MIWAGYMLIFLTADAVRVGTPGITYGDLYANTDSAHKLCMRTALEFNRQGVTVNGTRGNWFCVAHAKDR